MINDANLKEFINSNWGNISNIAYRNFLKLGRGLIGLKMIINEADGNREAKMVYGVFKDDSQIGADVMKMINDYDPEKEFLIQYMSDTNKATTVCIKSGENKTPKQIWVEMGSQIDEN